MDKLKVVDAAWHGMKGAWGMAKDQLTGDSGDDNYDPKLSPLQAFTNSSKLTANQSVRSGACAGRQPASFSHRGDGAEGTYDAMAAQVQVLRLQHVRMPPRVGHLFRPARRRRALLLRLLLVPMLPLGDG